MLRSLSLPDRDLPAAQPSKRSCTRRHLGHVVQDARPAAPAQREGWWIDSTMQRYMLESMQLQGDMVFTIDKHAPRRLSHQQARCACAAGLMHCSTHLFPLCLDLRRADGR